MAGMIYVDYYQQETRSIGPCVGPDGNGSATTSPHIYLPTLRQLSYPISLKEDAWTCKWLGLFHGELNKLTLPTSSKETLHQRFRQHPAHSSVIECDYDNDSGDRKKVNISRHAQRKRTTTTWTWEDVKWYVEEAKRSYEHYRSRAS